MKARYIFFVALVMLILIQPLVNRESNGRDFNVNENIIKISGFEVGSESTEVNTSAKGTIFVGGSDGSIDNVQIVALIEIDPNDWGGVGFYIPDGWNVSNIISSYPEELNQADSADYVAIWSTADRELDWMTMVEVGRDRSYRAMGGGTGTVVIELLPEEQLETFNIMVGVGSAEKDGIRIVHPDFVEISVSIVED